LSKCAYFGIKYIRKTSNVIAELNFYLFIGKESLLEVAFKLFSDVAPNELHAYISRLFNHFNFKFFPKDTVQTFAFLYQ
jgi:hypothetical protein